MTNKRIYDLTENTSPVAGEYFMIDKSGDSEAKKVNANRFTFRQTAQIYQGGTALAVPALKITQLDVSEEFIEFVCVEGVGNAIEAAGSKVLTTTHFVKMSLGGTIVYMPVGTIAEPP
jgi:hypothetical protein